MRFDSEPTDVHAGDLCPVYFRAKNLRTARVLLAHHVATQEIQSPVPEIVGRISEPEGLVSVAEKLNGLCSYNLPSFLYKVPFDGVAARKSDYPTVVNGHNSNQVEFRSTVELLDDYVAEFAFLILRDYVNFYNDSSAAPQLIPVEVRLERQSEHLLDHWTPSGHLDGTRDGEWDVAYLMSVGEPTIHYAGVQAGAVKNYRKDLDDAGMEQIRLKPGEIARIFRTSFHAPPMRYSGPRLIFITRRLERELPLHP